MRAYNIAKVGKKIQEHPFITAGIVFTLLAIIAFVVSVVKFGWDWTGFSSGASVVIKISTSKGATTATEVDPTKTLWDWLGLLAVLAIPIVVGFGAAWFTAKQGQVSEASNTDNQRENALQTYIDKMSELLIEKHLRQPQSEDEIRNVARVRTLTVLSRLDGKRKRSIIQFLEESQLIELINLSGADLSETLLVGSNLNKVNLSRANLSKTDLTGATLIGANLSFTNLQKADLSEADLSDANLAAANLSFARMMGTKLVRVKLMGTYMGNANMYNADLSDANLAKAKLSFPLMGGASIDVEGANLKDADLTNAVLKGAIVTEASQLKVAKSLKGATMPDGVIHTQR